MVGRERLDLGWQMGVRRVWQGQLNKSFETMWLADIFHRAQLKPKTFRVRTGDWKVWKCAA